MPEWRNRHRRFGRKVRESAARGPDRIAAQMRPVSAEAAIDAPRERVFELLNDLSVRPSFTDHFISSYRLLRIEPAGVDAGARFECELAGGWMDSVIVESEAPHRLVERGRGGRLNRVPNVTEWLLTDTPGTAGCEVRVTFTTTPQGFFDRLRDRRISERKLARAWRTALRRLREVAEAGEEPRRVAVAGADRI
jgi:uncharacterized protein YndB with AHSA1/START domain